MTLQDTLLTEIYVKAANCGVYASGSSVPERTHSKLGLGEKKPTLSLFVHAKVMNALRILERIGRHVIFNHLLTSPRSHDLRFFKIKMKALDEIMALIN